MKEFTLNKDNHIYPGEGKILVHEDGCRWHICKYSTLDIHTGTYTGLCGQTIKADQIIKYRTRDYICDECWRQNT